MTGDGGRPACTAGGQNYTVLLFLVRLGYFWFNVFGGVGWWAMSISQSRQPSILCCSMVECLNRP